MPESNENKGLIGRLRKLVGLPKSEKSLSDIKAELTKLNSPSISKQNYLDMVNNLHIRNGENGAESTKSIEELINKDVDHIKKNPDSERIGRYTEADFLVNSLPQVARALRIYTDNILSPDDITKQSLYIATDDVTHSSSDHERLSGQLKNIINSIGLEDDADDIVKTTVQFGDYFLEAVNLDEISLKNLTESSKLSEEFDESKMNIDLKLINFKSIKTATADDAVNLLNEQDVDTTKKKTESAGTSIDRILIKKHKPDKVLKIVKGSFVFGYLVFDQTIDASVTYGGRVNIHTHPDASIEKSHEVGKQGVINVVTTRIINTILDSLKKQDDELITRGSELHNIVTRLISDSEVNGLKVRFIANNRMVHFMIPGRFDHYGESLFFNIRSTAKMYMITLTALVIYRLTRSMEKRVFNIEIGETNDAAALIQSFKRSIKQKEIILSEDLSVDSIPDVVSMFEDYYIPQRDGQKFVEIDTISGGDIVSRMDEMEFLRKQLLVGLGVPPILLGYETDSAYTTTLAQENSMFATTIVRLQKSLMKGFTQITKIVHEMVNPNEHHLFNSEVKIVLQTPKALQIQRESEILSNLATIRDTLVEFDIPKEYVLEKYYGKIIDTELLKKFKDGKNIAKEIEPASKSEEDEEGGGGFGAGGQF